ncbi:hypothetical protein [Novosphingobium sp.]|uniref:hypothetical protein n=2 Tax=Novosphingobium sp. TaxID=1874826 RepID=UPI00286C4E8D|nr:hypothetical protein [Novosphingobium sp.]
MNMLMRITPIALAAALTAGCVTSPVVSQNGIAEVKLGQTADFGAAKVTVVKVLEDSRCPARVQCVWAGRVKVAVRIENRDGPRVRELTNEVPIQAGDGGILELLDVRPEKVADRAISNGDYRFTLRYTR